TCGKDGSTWWSRSAAARIRASTFHSRFRTRARRDSPEDRIMRMTIRQVAALTIALGVPAMAYSQSPKAATYISDEEVKKVNTLPGIDRQIKVVDIGNENLAVGIVHRGPTGAAAAGGGRRGAAPAAAVPAEACAEQAGAPPADAAATGISHDSQ